MKILHTADWHIGKKLHKHELSEDFDLFMEWLCGQITTLEIDLLLISGDIFDLANPSSEARRQYYRSLKRLRKLNCRIILTGGNHDSPAMLDAPKDILKELDMHVIGGLPEDPEDLIIPIKGKSGETELVVAAVPFLRDADLRSAAEGNTYEDRLEAIRQGIKTVFLNAAEICQTKYPGIPAVAMGHLFAAGAETSKSERDIQIGNQAAFNALQFGNYFQYLALGHIHKPQRINAAVPAFYSGSPLPLSFSERKDEKRVLILDTETGWEPENIPIPVFRSLIKMSGNLEQIQQKLEAPGEKRELDSLIELEMLEENYDATRLILLEEIVSDFNIPGFEIVKHRANFKNKLRGAGEIYQSHQLEDLNPREVFQELIATHTYDSETKNEILGAFDELLEEVRQNENPSI